MPDDIDAEVLELSIAVLKWGPVRADTRKNDSGQVTAIGLKWLIDLGEVEDYQEAGTGVWYYRLKRPER